MVAEEIKRKKYKVEEEMKGIAEEIKRKQYKIAEETKGSGRN